MEHQVVRLNKFLAERIGISRREADDLIAAGKVTIDGKPATLGTRIDKTSKVCYNGNIIPFGTNYIYLAMHKPIGYVCSRRAQGDVPTIYSLLPEQYHRLKTVGRLDKDSSGLILLTNDGDFAYQMTHPKFRKTKVYEVTLDRPLEPLHQQMISDYGIMLEDGVSKFAVIRLEDTAKTGGDAPSKEAEAPAAAPARYTVILSEGRNRQIRRTFAALGYRVAALHRTTFGPFSLGDLPSGKFQILDL